MADQNKDQDIPETETASMDDKSINELLKEYAEDVKDKDLDEFLKDTSDGDDAFEGNDNDADDSVAQGRPKKSGGVLTFLLFLVFCGAAGAGVWLYMNKDQGMTSVLGGFTGDDSATLETPPSPDATPTLPAADTAAVAAPEMTDMAEAPVDAAPAADAIPDPFAAADDSAPASDVPAPTPIVNETAPDAAAEETAPADLLSQPTASDAATIPATDTAATAESAPVAEAPAQPADATQAVSDWASTAGDGMSETNAKLDAGPAAEPARTAEKAPVADAEAVDVAEVNAKPVTVKAEQKSERASAPEKIRETSPYDEALPPPYVAIKAGKGADATTAVESATAASSSKMAPVVEATETTASDVAGYKRGSTAGTEPAETRASGIYKDLVKQGGGAIDLPGLTANVKNDITIGQAQSAPAPVNPAVSVPVDNGPVRLAIQGGRSLPETVTARTPTGTVTARLPAAEPVVPAVPVEAVEPEVTAPAKQIPAKATTKASTSNDRYSTAEDTDMSVVMPEAKTEAAPAPAAPAAAPAADGPSAELRGLVNQALAAEKSGDKAGAIKLYQRALEMDAVQNGGLDRGMVYDRIGALKAGQ